MRNSLFSGHIADLFSRIDGNRWCKRVNFRMCGLFFLLMKYFPIVLHTDLSVCVYLFVAAASFSHSIFSKF